MHIVHKCFETAVILLFVAIVLVGLGQVGNRFFFNISLSWSEEFQRYGHIWLVFLAIPIGYRRGAHIGVDILMNMLPDRYGRWLVLLIDAMWMLLGGLIIWGIQPLLRLGRNQISSGLDISMNYVYFGLVIGSTYLVICAAERIIRETILKPVEAQ
ncbi:TRAP transporter small permease [Rhodobacteraceae bacterium RKSG542]|uniref:TRAP transporter small permease n=1 Tax=Pseudovibrio flavus TaxID=2529854 RepID=UPI0012BD5145|nr:TRAP transporter small permease [Pseudovibrio flavus]MTI18177.1 TRAP transporter small permease [Pseudovibrio flavus]